MGNPVKQQQSKIGSMASKEVLCLLLLSGLGLALARSPPLPVAEQPLCECINPFICTANEWKGNPDQLCSTSGPGFCYVDCNADCSDLEPTASAARCQSTNACFVERGSALAFCG